MLGLVVGLGIDSLWTISLYQCAHSITPCRKNLHFHYLNRLSAIVTVLNTKSAQVLYFASNECYFIVHRSRCPQR